MRTKKSSRLLSITIALVLILTFSIGVIASAKDALYDVQFELTGSVDNNNAQLNQTFTATYTITPKPIPADKIEQKKKEVMLVIDTSTSMRFNIAGNVENNDRINIAKQAAKNFVNKVKDESNIEVGLIVYNGLADYKQPLTSNFQAVLNNIDNCINRASLSNGTNIGDALRMAYYSLMKGSSNADKYIVFLTDGEPSSYTVWNGTNNYFFSENGPYKRLNEWDDTWNRSGKGKDYAAKVIENLINPSSIPMKTYMVAFAEGDNAMEDLANLAGGEYKEAKTATDLNTVYDDIAKDIIKSVPIENGSFVDTFPAGISIENIVGLEGLVKNGQKISGNLPKIVYTLNAAGTEYTAPPIIFTIELKGNAVGSYILGKDNSSQFSYNDLDGTKKTKYFDEIEVDIVEFPLATIELVSSQRAGYNQKAKVRVTLPEGTGAYKLLKVDGSVLKEGTFTTPVSAGYTFEYDIPEFSIYRDYQIKVQATSFYKDESGAAKSSETNPFIVHNGININ